MAIRSSAVEKPWRGDARRALLDAAHALVRRQGWAATSIDELLAAAGVEVERFAELRARGVVA